MQNMSSGIFLDSLPKRVISSKTNVPMNSNIKNDFKSFLKEIHCPAASQDWDQPRKYTHCGSKSSDTGSKRSAEAPIKFKGKKSTEKHGISEKIEKGWHEEESKRCESDDKIIIPYEIIADILNALENMDIQGITNIDITDFDYMLKDTVNIVLGKVTESKDSDAVANLVQFIKFNLSGIKKLEEEGKLPEEIIFDKGEFFFKNAVSLAGRVDTPADTIFKEHDALPYTNNYNNKLTHTITTSFGIEPSKTPGEQTFLFSKDDIPIVNIEYAAADEEVRVEDVSNSTTDFIIKSETIEGIRKAEANQGLDDKQSGSFSELLKENDTKWQKIDNSSTNPEASYNADIVGITVNTPDDISKISSNQAEDIKKEDVIFQIVDKAKVILDGEKNEMSIDLKPDHLGKLSLKVVTERGIVMAEFVAENEQVKAVLESNMQFLKDALEKQGFNIQECAVSIGQGNTDDKGNNASHDQRRYLNPGTKIKPEVLSRGYDKKSLSSLEYEYGMLGESRINLTA